MQINEQEKNDKITNIFYDLLLEYSSRDFYESSTKIEIFKKLTIYSNSGCLYPVMWIHARTHNVHVCMTRANAQYELLARYKGHESVLYSCQRKKKKKKRAKKY